MNIKKWDYLFSKPFEMLGYIEKNREPFFVLVFELSKT